MSEFYDPAESAGSGKEYFFHADEFNEKAIAELGEGAGGEALESEGENFKFVGTLAKAALISILGTILIFQAALPRKIIVPDPIRAAIGMGTHPHTHTNEWIVDREATCGEPGLEYTLCTECGERAEEREIAANGHTVSEEWVVEKETSCEAPGLEVRRCTVCNEVCESREIPALEHKPKEEWETEKEATCTEPGEEVIKCEVCGQTLETREIEALGHKYPNKWTVRQEATCTRKGIEFRKCTVCEEEETRDIDIVDHKFSNWTVREDSTCTKKGTEYRKCSVCGTEETREIALKDHTPVTKTTKEPTCTATGTQTKSCSVCGQVLETTTIAAKGHSYPSTWTVDVASTCIKNGTESRVCTVCGQGKQTRELPLASHTLSEWEVRTPATCTEAGEEYRHCTVNGCNYEETKPIAAKGHSWSNWKVNDNMHTSVRECNICHTQETCNHPKFSAVRGDDYDYTYCTTCKHTAEELGFDDSYDEYEGEDGEMHERMVVYLSDGSFVYAYFE